MPCEGDLDDLDDLDLWGLARRHLAAARRLTRLKRSTPTSPVMKLKICDIELDASPAPRASLAGQSGGSPDMRADPRVDRRHEEATPTVRIVCSVSLIAASAGLAWLLADQVAAAALLMGAALGASLGQRGRAPAPWVASWVASWPRLGRGRAAGPVSRQVAGRDATPGRPQLTQDGPTSHDPALLSARAERLRDALSQEVQGLPRSALRARLGWTDAALAESLSWLIDLGGVEEDLDIETNTWVYRLTTQPITLGLTTPTDHSPLQTRQDATSRLASPSSASAGASTRRSR